MFRCKFKDYLHIYGKTSIKKALQNREFALDLLEILKMPYDFFTLFEVISAVGLAVSALMCIIRQALCG